MTCILIIKNMTIITYIYQVETIIIMLKWIQTTNSLHHQITSANGFKMAQVPLDTPKM